MDNVSQSGKSGKEKEANGKFEKKLTTISS